MCCEIEVIELLAGLAQSARFAGPMWALVAVQVEGSKLINPSPMLLREGLFNPLVVASSSWWLVGMLDDLNSGDAIKASKAVAR